MKYLPRILMGLSIATIVWVAILTGVECGG